MTTLPYVTVLTPCGEAHDYSLPGMTLSDSTDVRHDYGHAPLRGHYFDPDALRWFGSQRFATVAPGVSVERQSNSPETLPAYKVTAWRAPTADEAGQGPQPWFGCRHSTRREATACARRYAATLAAGGAQ